MKRVTQIDYLKGFAIISVILLHSMTIAQRDIIGGSYYILQAVPVFLILVGYNSVNSYVNRGISDIKKCYEKTYINKRLKNIIVPFIYICIFKIFMLVIEKQPFTIKSLMLTFATGGWGPGGYFVPLMIQVILIIPVLYITAQYNRHLMLGASFIIGMIFEFYSYYTDMIYWLYRIVSLRYLFVIALGVYLALYKIEKKKIFIIGVLFSLVYITSINYFGLDLPVYQMWQSQNTPSFFYPFALVILGLKILPSKSETVIGKILEIIGRRSYHIYLFQTLYFVSFSKITSQWKVYFSIPINLLLCVIFGLVFYYFENKISKYLHLYKKNNINEPNAK